MRGAQPQWGTAHPFARHPGQLQPQHHTGDVMHQLQAGKQGSSGRSERAVACHAGYVEGVAMPLHAAYQRRAGVDVGVLVLPQQL